jgi:hypothetical protein
MLKRSTHKNKRLLAIVFAAEKFEHCIYGKRTVIHSDHRPLQTIFQKPISKTTHRLQRMLVRIARFDLDKVYRPGKHMHVADAAVWRVFTVRANKL